MNDRTSYSYRATLPGGHPDMAASGGKAREAFREARTSPYIREHAEKPSQQSSSGSDEGKRQAFRAKRKRPVPAPSPNRGQSL